MVGFSEIARALAQIAFGKKFQESKTIAFNQHPAFANDPLSAANVEFAQDVVERRKQLVIRMGFKNKGSAGYETDQNPFDLISQEVEIINKNPVRVRDGQNRSRLTPLFLHDVAHDLRESEFKGTSHDFLDQKYSPEELADILDKYIKKYHGRFDDNREISARGILKNLQSMKEEHKVLIHKTKLDKLRHYRAEVITNYLTQKLFKTRHIEDKRKVHELQIKIEGMCLDVHNDLAIRDISAELPKDMKSEWMSYMWGSEK